MADRMNIRRPRGRFSALDLGPLPVELVGSILRCTLTPGAVYFSAANQDHAYERHAEDFIACFPHIAPTVADPHFIGQSPRHPDAFEMVRAIGGSVERVHVLVAVTLYLGGDRRYPVQSVYPIGRGTVYRRVKKGYLFPVG